MEENNMDSLTTNTPAPTVSTEATQPVQQAQLDKVCIQLEIGKAR